MKKVAVTGGNGRIGKAILRNLNEFGYWTVNLARGKRREEISDQYITTDLLDPGNVYASMAKCEAEAVIHMGTIPGPNSHPGYVTYRSNVMSSYHILEAASFLKLESVCLASSINAIGYAYQEAPVEIFYLPLDEEHPATPRDPYGLGKRVMEITADGFGRLDRPPRTIVTLRYPWVVKEEQLRRTYKEADRSLPALRGFPDPSGPLFTYIHIEDAAEIARLAIEADFEGHENFWAVAKDTTAEVSTETLIEEFYPHVELRTDFSRTRSLIDTRKAEKLLNWKPKRSWRHL